MSAVCAFSRFLTQKMPKGGRYAGDAAQRKGNGTMFTPLITAFFVFAIILARAFSGAVARRYVPEHHQTEETKSVVSISMAVVATISALVLGERDVGANPPAGSAPQKRN